MTDPVTARLPPLEHLLGLKGDDLIRELWMLIGLHMDYHSNVTRKGAIDLNAIFGELYEKQLDDMDGAGFPDRARDALATLCERGLVWFRYSGVPNAIGQRHPQVAQYEFTPKGRQARVEEVTSGWPSGRGLLERFPEHAQWDETMGAFFRMAVRTYEAGVYEAATFLLGGAAERLLDLVEARVESLLPSNWSKLKKAGERLDGLVGLFKSRDHSTSELICIIGNVARWNRNDVGHPRISPPQVDPGTVLTMLCNFRDYVTRVLATADALVGVPPP